MALAAKAPIPAAGGGELQKIETYSAVRVFWRIT